MVLSRFWLTIFISSIAFIVFGLFSGQNYTIDNMLNGKKDDPILISEKYIDQLPIFIKPLETPAQNKSNTITPYHDRLALSLLVPRIGAHNEHNSASTDNFAFFTNTTNAGANLHLGRWRLKPTTLLTETKRAGR